MSEKEIENQEEVVEQGEVVEAEESKELESVTTALAYAHTSYLHCDRCFLASRGCPKYQPGSQCTMPFDEIFKTFGSEAGIGMAAFDLAYLQYIRIKRAAAQEEMTGGLLDKQLSDEIKRFYDILKTMRNMNIDEETIIFKRTGPRKKKGGGDGGSGLLKEFLGGGE